MTYDFNDGRKILAGKEVGTFFGILLAGTLFFAGGFVPWYAAVLFASGLRNVYFVSLGSGILFYGVAVILLYFEAVVLTTVFLTLRYGYQRVHNRTQRNASV